MAECICQTWLPGTVIPVEDARIRNDSLQFKCSICGEWFSQRPPALPKQPRELPDPVRPDLSLIDLEFLQEIALAMGKSLDKYERNDWRKAKLSWSSRAASLWRHWLDFWWHRQDKDHESGYHPLAHLAANAMLLFIWDRYGAGTDDRSSHQGIIPAD